LGRGTEIPVYSVVAYSGVGKTTLLERLIPVLKRRGLRVAAVKHDAHGFELDREGKDTWRLTRAGADVTAIVSESAAAVMDNRPLSFDDVLERVTGVDIILTEGYRHGGCRKIALLREDSGKPLAIAPEECFVIMSDAPIQAPQGVKILRLGDAETLAELLAEDAADSRRE
jgi:molybdopterin-guanine dinucleotide biosynthesis protein MobB